MNSQGNDESLHQDKSSGINLLLTLSVLFLVVVVALTVLLGSGVLVFGLEGPFMFLIYVVSGLLVSISCFGILSSSGEIYGKNFGAKWKLGGAIVGFVTVAVGGSLYEIIVRPNPTLNIQFVMTNSDGELSDVSGELRVLVGAESQTVTLSGSGIAQLRNLPPSWKNRPIKVFLNSPNWTLTRDQGIDSRLGVIETVYLSVERKSLFSSYDESELALSVDSGISDEMVTGERTYTFYVSVASKSPRKVPLRAQAEVRITNNGLLMRNLNADVSDGTMSDLLTIEPRVPTQLYVNGMFPHDWDFLLERNPDTYLRFFYYNLKSAQQLHFDSKIFTLDRNFLKIPEPE